MVVPNKTLVLTLKDHGECSCALWVGLFVVCDSMAVSSSPLPILYDHQEGEKVPIPDEYGPEDTHPLKTFEETHVEANVYRWVVFVLWLKPLPHALGWYRIIQKAHPHSVPTIQTLWDYCQKVWHLEKQKRKR